MRKTHKPRGVVAICTAALAAAGFAGHAVAEEECADLECLADQAIVQLMDADGVDPEQLAELFEEIKVTYDEDLGELLTDMRPLSDPEQLAELFEEIKVQEDQ